MQGGVRIQKRIGAFTRSLITPSLELLSYPICSVREVRMNAVEDGYTYAHVCRKSLLNHYSQTPLSQLDSFRFHQSLAKQISCKHKFSF
ncbi:hypothetical protein ABIF83_000091 [Bradyrhizobium ottawaense]|jgi:hypothetical protein